VLQVHIYQLTLIKCRQENDCRSLGEIFSDSSFLLALGQLVVLLVLPLVIYSVGIYLAAVQITVTLRRPVN